MTPEVDVRLSDQDAFATAPTAVSVLICARDHPDGLRRALAGVLAQKSDDVEVIVIHHGQTTLAEPIDERVQLISIGPRTRGAARAAGFRAARGELIAYCDDVDEWLPGHLTRLRNALTADSGLAAVYGVERWVDAGYEPVAPLAIDPWPHPTQTPHIPASAVMHRAVHARRMGGFDATVDAYAIWDLCLRMSDWWGLEQVSDLHVLCRADQERDEFAVNAFEDRTAIARHAMGRRIRTPRHRPARSPRRTPSAFDPSTWTGETRELTVHSVYGGRHSYASVNAGLLPALEREGVSIFLGSTHSEVPPELGRYPRSPGDTRRIPLFYEVGNRPRQVGIEPLVQYTMMEQDLLPLIHVEEINRYVSLLFVPCRMCAESFRRCGVEVPIQVLHHGVDTEVFPYLDREEREVFTFGTFGQQNERKGVDVLMHAFEDEFRPHEPARLVLNATMSGSWLTSNDPRIEIRSAYLDRDGVREYLRELDVMVLPSRGEGFGLCGLEAMATGLPLIATNWSGPAEYLDPSDSYPLAYQLVETEGYRFIGMRLFGRWAEPSYEHLRTLMRRLYENRSEGRDAGRRASQRIHREWTWGRAARQVIAGVDQLAAGISPFGEY